MLLSCGSQKKTMIASGYSPELDNRHVLMPKECWCAANQATGPMIHNVLALPVRGAGRLTDVDGLFATVLCSEHIVIWVKRV
jgi:hypothetical protein